MAFGCRVGEALRGDAVRDARVRRRAVGQRIHKRCHLGKVRGFIAFKEEMLVGCAGESALACPKPLPTQTKRRSYDLTLSAPCQSHRTIQYHTILQLQLHLRQPYLLFVIIFMIEWNGFGPSVVNVLNCDGSCTNQDLRRKE